MKKDTWKTIIQVVISVLTAALTALGTTSCMGHGPIRGFNCVEPPHARHSSSKLGSVLA